MEEGGRNGEESEGRSREVEGGGGKGGEGRKGCDRALLREAETRVADPSRPETLVAHEKPRPFESARHAAWSPPFSRPTSPHISNPTFAQP